MSESRAFGQLETLDKLKKEQIISLVKKTKMLQIFTFVLILY